MNARAISKYTTTHQTIDNTPNSTMAPSAARQLYLPLRHNPWRTAPVPSPDARLAVSTGTSLFLTRSFYAVVTVEVLRGRVTLPPVWRFPLPVERLAPKRLTTGEFFKRTVIVLLVALIPVLVWFLFDVILIAIGAILVAALIHLVAEPFVQRCRLPQSIALIISGIVIAGVVAGAAYLFGTQVDAELSDVLHRATAAVSQITKQMQGSEIGKLLLTHIQGGSGFSIPGLLSRIFSGGVSFLEALVVIVIGGLYIAAQPRLYRSGLVQLFPPKWHANVNETLDDIGHALRLWLLGEIIQMVLIGALSTAAVWLIGLPSPLALGVIAGFAEFVPYLGPIIAAVPALLVATTQGGDAILWTALAYLFIHQIEGNVVVPLIQRHMIFIPPAVMLLGIVTILFLFGGLSVVFAGPIAVIIFVAIKKLYVRDSLGEKTSIPGEAA